MKLSRIEEKQGKKTVAIARFWMGYKITLASLGQIVMAASVVRSITLMPYNIVLNNERIYMM